MIMKTRSILLLTTIFTACRGDGMDDQATMDSAAHAEGDSDPDSDAWHCGELGLKCVGALGIGECINGECQPALEPICTGNMTCEQVCNSVESTCAERGCEGATAFAFVGDSQAEANARCLDGLKFEATPFPISCTEQPSGELPMSWLCCCE
jgi:hypothetical protein